MHEVKDISGNNDITVEFQDGHKAIFISYHHGYGYDCEGLRSFELYKGEEKVCIWNGRLYRCGPQEKEHKLVFLKEGYTQQQVAEYWRSAKKHLDQVYFKADPSPDELWWPWRLLQEGWIDLSWLEEGNAKFIEKDVA